MANITAFPQECKQITHLRDMGGGASDSGDASRPLRIYVLHSDPCLTGPALVSAAEMAADLRAEVVLLAVREVPYPLPVDRPNFDPGMYLNNLQALAGEVACPVRIELILTREKRETLREYLCPGSLAIIATRKHWWRTAEERLARSLKSAGCKLSLLTLRISKTGFITDRISCPAPAGIKDPVQREVSHA